MKQTFNEKLNIPNWISLDEVCKILSLKEKTVKNKCRNAEYFRIFYRRKL